jgi:hypothetical protein
MMSLNLRAPYANRKYIACGREFVSNDMSTILFVDTPEAALALKNQGCEIVVVNWGNVAFTVG